MSTPQLSVVMAVYNEEQTLAATMDSVLSQTEVELELIVVNDGSSDNSEAIIRQRMQDDPRVKLLEQDNQGITQALINGCQRARANIIARQDAGDQSLPGRFKAQIDALNNDKTLVMCSVGVSFIAPDGEEFNRIIQAAEQANTGLRQRNIKTIKGPPHHGCVMFRKNAYEQAGGYRKEFVVAQDLDLWTRMIEYGQHTSLQAVYYQANASQHAISHQKRDQQIAATQLIIDCCHARKKLGSDEVILRRVPIALTSIHQPRASLHKSEANFFYFIGSNLMHSNPKAGKKYLKRALRANRLHWKAWIKLCLNPF